MPFALLSKTWRWLRVVDEMRGDVEIESPKRTLLSTLQCSVRDHVSVFPLKTETYVRTGQ